MLIHEMKDRTYNYAFVPITIIMNLKRCQKHTSTKDIFFKKLCWENPDNYIYKNEYRLHTLYKGKLNTS